MKKKVVFLFLIAFLYISAFSGCTNPESINNKELKLGKYISEDGLAWVLIEENNELTFSSSILVDVEFEPSGVLTNMWFQGNYRINDGMLFLSLWFEKEDLVFEVNGSQLKFFGGEAAEPFVDIGKTFNYSDSEE